MKIMVDENELNLLLEKKRNYIGKKVTIDSILSSISFLISVIFATYEDFLGLPGKFWKYFGCMLGLFFAGKVSWDFCRSKKYNYTHEDLSRDINELNKIEHRHTIVVIKDTFNEFPNRYLVYYDGRWDCKLFINYKTNDKNNEEFIKGHISSDFKVPVENISLKYVTQQTHEKFSVSNNRMKTYEHIFYLAEISDMPNLIMQDTFELDGKMYYWETMHDLEKDTNIMKKNADVLGMVKSNF